MLKIIPPLLISCLILSSITLASNPPIFVDSLESAIVLSEEIRCEVLVIFSAEWCSYCQNLKNDINSKKLDDVLCNKIICYVDYDESKQLVKKYNVKKIPDSRLIETTGNITKFIGYNKDKYIIWLKK
jgi:thioredoxin-like negative regulator of GroEL